MQRMTTEMRAFLHSLERVAYGDVLLVGQALRKCPDRTPAGLAHFIVQLRPLLPESEAHVWRDAADCAWKGYQAQCIKARPRLRSRH